MDYRLYASSVPATKLKASARRLNAVPGPASAIRMHVRGDTRTGGRKVVRAVRSRLTRRGRHRCAATSFDLSSMLLLPEVVPAVRLVWCLSGLSAIVGDGLGVQARWVVLPVVQAAA